VLFRELDPAVNDDDIVAAFHGHHIFADLAKPTQGNDT
jgi:hypothetical protein